jgi:hypothetical protein
MATVLLKSRPITLKKVCSQWFDMRDLAQVAEHVHDGSEIEAGRSMPAGTRRAGTSREPLRPMRQADTSAGLDR